MNSRSGSKAPENQTSAFVMSNEVKLCDAPISSQSIGCTDDSLQIGFMQLLLSCTSGESLQASSFDLVSWGAVCFLEGLD